MEGRWFARESEKDGRRVPGVPWTAVGLLALAVGACGVAGRDEPVRFMTSPVIEANRPERFSVDPWEGVTELGPDDLVREVIGRNPGLEAMRQAWRAAVERHPQVTALDDPELSYGVAPGTIGNRRLAFGQRIDVSQKFPWPGKLATRGEVALAEANAAAEDAESMRLRLVEAARTAFADWFYVHRAIEINGENQELLAELRRIAENRYGAGLTSKQDALRAEVAYQHLVHRGVVLRRMREVAAARINALLNRPPRARVPAPPANLAAPSPLPSLDDLLSRAVEGRPVLGSLRRQVQARKAEVRLSELEYFPNLTVGATYNSLWQEERLRTMGTVGINVPIQVGRRSAALNEDRARLREAQSRLEERRSAVRLEVARAYDEAEEQAHVKHLYATSILPAAEESLAAARSGYETGTNDFLTLIDAEEALRRAEDDYYEALAGYQKAVARLERAVGASLEDLS